MEAKCVYCAVRTVYLYVIQCDLGHYRVKKHGPNGVAVTYVVFIVIYLQNTRWITDNKGGRRPTDVAVSDVEPTTQTDRPCTVHVLLTTCNYK